MLAELPTETNGPQVDAITGRPLMGLDGDTDTLFRVVLLVAK
jgi:hypothetical protein